MLHNARSVEFGRWIPAIVPINTTGAAQTGDYIDMTGYRRCAIVILKGAWAGGTSAVTLEQATAAAGTGTKALAFDKQYVGTALTDDLLAETSVSSNTFNLSTTANEYHVIEVNASDLDHENGFKYITVKTATPGANNDLVAALYFLYDATHPGKTANHVSQID